MASFQHPILCLQHVKRQSQGLSDLLVASAGRHIYSYAATNGQRLDAWPKNVDSSSEPDASAASTSEGQAPPEKRRKISSSEEQEGKTPAPTTKSAKQAWTSIPLLVVSADSKYLVAMTAEDKAIRVLEIDPNGQLKELSSRTMPKRPSSLCLTPDGQHILCGDKFGDAYSLPLIPMEYVKVQAQAKDYKPAATSLTVHTKRNLFSLEQQKREQEKREAEKKNKPADQNEPLNFEHQHILGHVSMLLDILSPEIHSRSYVLTADRDEHIRVSRGIPQAHVIENYCLGHTSLISKLCIPSWAPEVLISGGGDGNLFVWDWSKGQALQQIAVNSVVQVEEPIVRGIWAVSSEHAKAVLVSLEGYVPPSFSAVTDDINRMSRSAQLLCFIFEQDGTLKFQDIIQLGGNVLDVVGIESRGSIVVSVDSLREPGSTNTWRSNPAASSPLLEPLHINSSPDGLKFAPSEDALAVGINSTGTSELSAALDAKQKKELDDSLYSLANMKKKVFDE